MQQALQTQKEIETFLVEKLAMVLRTSPDQIGIDDDLATYGIDSLDAMTIMGQLSDRCGVDIDFDVVWDYTTIAEVAQYVAAEVNNG
jgi:myxalamid-type polyketide synthase MxaB